MFKKTINFLHFHKRRVAVSAFCVGAYTVTCVSATKWQSEVLRFGIAGSIANVIIETAFHCADTVNIRAKASKTNVSTTSMISKIYAQEGIKGFGRGFSAMFYGGIVYGFCFFAIYKVIKGYFKDYFDGSVDLAICYLLASFTTEVLTLSVKYPYDLIKCRL